MPYNQDLQTQWISSSFPLAEACFPGNCLYSRRLCIWSDIKPFKVVFGFSAPLQAENSCELDDGTVFRVTAEIINLKVRRMIFVLLIANGTGPTI